MIAALAPRAFAVFERNVRVYRRQWLMIVTGFFEPLFFLLGIGFGVGHRWKELVRRISPAEMFRSD